MKMPRDLSSVRAMAVAGLGVILLAGCASNAPLEPAEKLPNDVLMTIGPRAKLVKQGKPPLSYKLGRAGTISVIDMTAGRMHSFGMINTAGAVMTVDAKENAIVIHNPKSPNTREVLAGASPLDPDHIYGIYYSPGL